MELYKITQKKIKLISKKRFGLEKHLQKIIENNLDELFDLRIIASEFTVGKYSTDKLGRIDTLAYDEKNKSFVIIEYKNSESKSVIDQGFSYLSELLDRKSDFIEKLNEVLKNNIRNNEIEWSQSKVIFISPSYTPHQINGSNFKDLPIELWTIQLFEDDLFSLTKIMSTSNESINKINKNKEMQKVSNVVNIVSEEVHVSKTNDVCKKIWQEICEKYLKFGDTSINVKKGYIGIKRNNTTMFYVVFYKTYLKIEMIAGYTEGKIKKKNYLEFKDEKRFGKINSNRKGTDIFENLFSFKLGSEKDLSYAIYLMDQKYNNI